MSGLPVTKNERQDKRKAEQVFDTTLHEPVTIQVAGLAVLLMSISMSDRIPCRADMRTTRATT